LAKARDCQPQNTMDGHFAPYNSKAGGRIKRIVVAFEADQDGFWLARWLQARGIEAYVIL